MLKIFGFLMLLLPGLFLPNLLFANEQILRFKTPAHLEHYLRFTPETVVSVLPEIKTVVIQSSQSKASLFNENPGLIGIEEPVIIRVQPLESKSLVPTENLSPLWGIRAIEANSVWQWTTGAQVVVAVSDTGVWHQHPDLAANMWKNPGEIPGNGIDDDGNGFIDDVMGWNYVNKNGNTDDSHYHGTHVAGTIAAVSDDSGVVGVAPNVKIMALKFMGSDGNGTDYNGAQTIIYAAKNGAKIVNCSWGSDSNSAVLNDAVEFAKSKGVLVIAAAGNDNVNTDKKSHFPSALPSENILSIGATYDAKGQKASFSNYGKVSVDISAPGQGIYSTIKPNPKDRSRYAKLSGTSMASPHVAGLAALIWSYKPSLNWREVKATIMNTGTSVSYWKDKSQTGKVINARAAISSLQ